MAKVTVLRYGEKEWFMWALGLNGSGPIPGSTLREEHISKAECVKWFGEPKSKNGYRVGGHFEFQDRLSWLWKRVHQGPLRKGKDFGLHFAQGLLYEYTGQGEVDWAALAVKTVKFYRATKGVTPMADEFLSFHPTYTIDICTRVGPVNAMATCIDVTVVPEVWLNRVDHPTLPVPRSNERGSRPVVRQMPVSHLP
jgi:hypothetical protein